MSFASDTGYVPVTFDSMMDYIRVGLNAQFNTGYTVDTFVGSNHYKYFYVLVQRALENENKAAEIFAKLQQYIGLTNQRIQRPSVSLPGLIDTFESKGFVVAVKPTLYADRGTISVCVLVDYTLPNYITKKNEIITILLNSIPAGMVTMGGEEAQIGLSNGQFVTLKFYLPYYIPIKLRLTLDVSDNFATTIPNDEALRVILQNNIKARYRLGWDFEPQRYLTQADIPWAGSIKLEWSDDNGSTWSDDIKQLTYQDLVTFGIDDITVVFV